MIGWLQPAALWGLALLAAPVAVHFLRRRRARRVPFPTVRFVTASQGAAARVRPPSDLLLLAMRSGIVALAVCATAGPVVITQARVDGWNARVVRVAVVDTSDSVRRSVSGGRGAADELSKLADGALAGAHTSRRFETPDLRRGIRQAVAWLESAPPARRELILVSDFQHGAVDDEALAIVPGEIGIRTVRAADLPVRRAVQGLQLLGTPSVPARIYELDLSRSGTTARLRDVATARQPGLRLIAADQSSREIEILERAVALAGTPAPSADRPLAVAFADSTLVPAPTSAPRAAWMLRTVVRLHQDDQLMRSARTIPASRLRAPAGAIPVVRNARGEALVHASALGPELLLAVAAPAGSYFAAVVVRAALLARQRSVAMPEQEVASDDDATLAAWNRPGTAVSRQAWRHSETSDARWCWLATLLLMATEQWMRGGARRPSESERHVEAA